ncbi:hypothetical protein [Gloeothece verrucosa]|uniref:Uncharacterized protein n=1 Tax=Gloeothece verrucosa (strain PCC 7822) TaxID=497965 RepID=E0UG22_GLOV7|nr:hypothetical protein [Gloeothece verrucosa]ADN15523.1 hypothetical protein Cyan7822_3582 [Gloeothece verrucosa PCC 7822]
MKIRFLSGLSVAALSLCLSWPVLAQNSAKPDSGNTSNPSTSETMTEDTPSQTPEQLTPMNDKPSSPDGSSSTSETNSESQPGTSSVSQPRLEQMTNTSGENPKPSSQTIDPVQNPTKPQVTPTTTKPQNSVPDTIKK